MKKYLYIFYLLVAVSAVAACTKYDAYKQFVPDGERIYPQKPNALTSYPGNGRVMLEWMLIDPNVEYCEVSWSEGTQLKTQKVEATPRPVDDIFTVIIDGLDELSYIFNVAAYDGYGNVSVKAEVEGTVYGQMYTASLMSRMYRSAVANESEVSITWYSPIVTEAGMEITYTTVADGEKQVIAPVDEAVTVLTDVDTTAPISYRTMFKPVDNVIDTFYTASVEITLP